MSDDWVVGPRPGGASVGVAADLPADWLSMAVRTAHVAVGVSSLSDGAFVDVNDAFCRLFQWPREAVIGRSSAELCLWPDAGQRERMLALIRSQGSITGYEAAYCNRHGERGRLQVSATIVQCHGAACLVVFLTEVSAQHEMLQGLQAAQARLGVALRASGLLVFRQDSELRYTWVANPALGATEADLIGRSDAQIFGAEAAAPLMAIKHRVLRTGQAERRDVWVANNGQLGCFDLVVEPEIDAAGRVVAIVCAAQDITRRKTGAELDREADGPPDPDAAQVPRALRQLLHTIQGQASLIAREQLSEWQLSRLQRIARDAGLLDRQPATLPLLPGEAPAEGRALRRLRQHHAGARVLVTEHNPVLRELITALLEQAGLLVVQATSGVEAFSLSLQWAPALLLLDMELPQRGGVAAARALRTMLQRRLPIVAMVSPPTQVTAAPALDADLDDVIDKPVAADRLYEKVLAWLQA